MTNDRTLASIYLSDRQEIRSKNDVGQRRPLDKGVGRTPCIGDRGQNVYVTSEG